MKRYVVAVLILLFAAANCYAVPQQTNTCYTATGAAAMAGSYTVGTVAKDIKEVRVHLSSASATSENLVISVDSRHGSAYDVVLVTQDMNTVQNLAWSPDGIIHMEEGDKLLVTWANTNTRTWGLEVICEK